MSTSVSEQLAQEWHCLSSAVAVDVQRTALALAARHCEVLATHFYDVMLEDPLALHFLTHEQVRDALHPSMQKWLVRVLDVDAGTDMVALVDEQIHVGDVHARVGIPVHIVLRGARALKEKYHELILGSAGPDDDHQLKAFGFIVNTIDFAMEVMSAAYISSQERNMRSEESYRLFSMVQDAATEKEHQRSMLLDWENRVMYDHLLSPGELTLPRIGESDFGLWFKHKGAHIFEGAYETRVILDAIRRLDTEILPALARRDADSADLRREQALRDMQTQSRAIQGHLERLFDKRSDLDAGRDALTRLLSRRFLDVILSKETAYARKTGTRFALLAIDIDYFKDVNDRYGHDAGDQVLQQFALLLTEQTRGGDYVFRLGGEEFLVVLVDVKGDGAFHVAEKLRQRTAHESFRILEDTSIAITISMGVALYDGHPDHGRILRQADTALYSAKNSGRNAIVRFSPELESAENRP